MSLRSKHLKWESSIIRAAAAIEGHCLTLRQLRDLSDSELAPIVPQVGIRLMIRERIPLFFNLIKAAAKANMASKLQRPQARATKENSQFEGFDDDEQRAQSDEDRGAQSDDDQGPQSDEDQEGSSSSEDERPILISSDNSSEIYESDEA